MFFLLLTCFSHSWSSNTEFRSSWAHCTTKKKKQEKHCRLEKQLSRGCARQRHLAQVGDELGLPAEIEIQLLSKLFAVICADFPNQLQAGLSPLQGVSNLAHGPVRFPAMRQVTEVASEQEGLQISQQQPAMFSVYSLSVLADAEFKIHPGNPRCCYSCRPSWWEMEGKDLEQDSRNPASSSAPGILSCSFMAIVP